MITIKVLGDSNGWRAKRAIFDPHIDTKSADGLLSWGLPTQEFNRYNGVKAWYFTEPLFFNTTRFTHLCYSYLRSQPADFLHFSRRRRRLHVPMITHYSPMPISSRPWQERLDTFLAVVSNFGGKAWWLNHSHQLRNRFITHPRVNLFGSLKEWREFKPSLLERVAIPANYRGEWDSTCTWKDPSHVEQLSKYRYIIALENSCEHRYLTEKLVNAFRAGSVPIYHAHPSVRELLRGAKWIDPADHGFSVDATLDAALAADHEDITAHNFQWLKSNSCASTDGWEVWNRLGDYFHDRLNARLSL